MEPFHCARVLAFIPSSISCKSRNLHDSHAICTLSPLNRSKCPAKLYVRRTIPGRLRSPECRHRVVLGGFIDDSGYLRIPENPGKFTVTVKARFTRGVNAERERSCLRDALILCASECSLDRTDTFRAQTRMIERAHTVPEFFQRESGRSHIL